MGDHPKRMKRLLRELAVVAHERELRRALVPVAEAFRRWENGDVSSFELSDVIHEYHDGLSRQLFVKYARPHDYTAVAHAIAIGVLDRTEVPLELLDYLARAIEYYESERAE